MRTPAIPTTTGWTHFPWLAWLGLAMLLTGSWANALTRTSRVSKGKADSGKPEQLKAPNSGTEPVNRGGANLALGSRAAGEESSQAGRQSVGSASRQAEAQAERPERLCDDGAYVFAYELDEHDHQHTSPEAMLVIPASILDGSGVVEVPVTTAPHQHSAQLMAPNKAALMRGDYEHLFAWGPGHGHGFVVTCGGVPRTRPAAPTVQIAPAHALSPENPAVYAECVYKATELAIEEYKPKFKAEDYGGQAKEWREAWDSTERRALREEMLPFCVGLTQVQSECAHEYLAEVSTRQDWLAMQAECAMK